MTGRAPAVTVRQPASRRTRPVTVPGEGMTARTSSVPFAMVGLLMAALTINYVDRGTVSTAGPLLKTQLHLSTSQTFLMLSAFFWTYVPSQPVMGWLADRIGAARVLAGGVALWSLATCLAGFSQGVVQLIGLRPAHGDR